MTAPHAGAHPSGDAARVAFPVTYYNYFSVRPDPSLRENLQRGVLIFPPHPAMSLRPHQWRVLPTADRNWNFRHQSLQFLLPLLGSGDQRDWREAMRWIRAWAKEHAPGAPAGPMAWYPHGAAIRALVLATAYGEAVRRRGGRDLESIAPLLRRHRRFLADDRHFEETNHGVTEAVALIEVERMLEWPRARPRASLVTRGVDRLVRVVERGVSPAGIHREGSPEYHVYFLDEMLRALEYLARVLPPQAGRRLRGLPARLDAMVDSAWYFRDLGGRLPPIGDAEVRDPEAKLAVIGRRLDQLGPPRARAAAAPAVRVLYDEDAGFAFFKETRSNGGRYAVFRIQDRMPLSHAHNDALSLFFQQDGVDVFCDSGKYSYNHGDPLRRYLTSRFAHNTAEPRNRELDEYVVARNRRRLVGGDVGFAAAVELDAPRFAHRRSVRFPARGRAALRVVDEMRGAAYVLRWQLGAELGLRLVRSTARSARFASTGLPLAIAVEIRADHDIVAEIAPAREGDPAGWRSERWGELAPGAVLLVRPRSPARRVLRVETRVLRAPSGVARSDGR